MKFNFIYLGLFFLLSACPGKKDLENKELKSKEQKMERTYMVATDATYAPFEFQTGSQEIVGFEIELFKEIAKVEGLSIQFLNTPWEGIFTQLLNGDRDVVVSAVTITEEQKKHWPFQILILKPNN